MKTSRSSVRFLASLVTVLLVWPVAASAQDTISDIRKQREQARDAKAAALAEVDLLELQDAEIAGVLEEIQASVDAQVARVEGARQALDAAVGELEHRRQLAAAATDALAATNTLVADRAVESYVGTFGGADGWLVAADLNESAIRQSLIGFTSGSDRDLLDELRRLGAERDQQVLAGEAAQVEADALRTALEDELVQLEERRRTQNAIRAAVQARIDEWQADAAQLQQAADDMTQLIQRKQAEALGFDPGVDGVESVKGFVFPKKGHISSKFGPRTHPIFGSTASHPGVDITGRLGDPIWAAKAGRVIFAGWRGGYGNAVVIQHSGRIATLYGHLSALKTEVGDVVEPGEVIGLTGTTGFSTGPHLHFEVRVDGVPKDPELFLPG